MKTQQLPQPAILYYEIKFTCSVFIRSDEIRLVSTECMVADCYPFIMGHIVLVNGFSAITHVRAF